MPRTEGTKKQRNVRISEPSDRALVMTEDDPLVVTMTCFDCDEHVLVTVPGAQTAVRGGVHVDEPFRTTYTAACPECAADMSRAVTLWVDGAQIMLQLDPIPAVDAGTG